MYSLLSTGAIIAFAALSKAHPGPNPNAQATIISAYGSPPQPPIPTANLFVVLSSIMAIINSDLRTVSTKPTPSLCYDAYMDTLTPCQAQATPPPTTVPALTVPTKLVIDTNSPPPVPATATSYPLALPPAPVATAQAAPASGGATAECAVNGQLVCNGSWQFGLCSNGAVTFQPVAEGTLCSRGQIITDVAAAASGDLVGT